MFLVETVDEVCFCSFSDVISTYFPTDQRIVIFGAGVRGILFGYLLEQNGYFDFLYADNDSAKWGKELNGHRIVSKDEIKKGDDLIFISIEYAEEIVRELRKDGFMEGKDYVILRSGIREEYIKEFFDDRETDTLLFGDAGLTAAVLTEDRKVSLQTELREVYGDRVRYLGLGVVGLNQVYELLRVQKEYVSTNARRIILFSRFEMLTKHIQFLPRVQHGELMGEIYKRLRVQDDEFEDFIRISYAREENYLIEKKYSPVRTDESSMEAARQYMHVNLIYALDECSEQYLMLERIFRYCRTKMMECIFVVMPINYDEIHRFYPEEEDIPLCNLEKMKQLANLYQVRFLDFSRLLTTEQFVVCSSIDEGIRDVGRRKLVEMIRNECE